MKTDEIVLTTNTQNSTWTPPEKRNENLDLYINCFRKRVQSDLFTNKRKTKDNLTAKEKRAIKNLRSNQDIVIKPADKGGAVVV